MTSVNDIFIGNKPQLVGRLVCAGQDGNIVKTEIPKMKDVLVISAEDFETPKIKILNDFVPILAHHKVDFPGQAVLAVFAPNTEILDYFISQIKIVAEPEKTEYTKQSVGTPFKFSNGLIFNYFKDDENVLSSEYLIASHSKSMLGAQKFFACNFNDKLYLKLSSQWPVKVKETVASVLRKPQDKIVLINESFDSHFDQLLIMPFVASVISAVAAQKSGMNVELQVPAISWQPALNFYFKMQLNSENKPVAFMVTVDIDFGAYPIFTEEACINIMAGLIPQYKIDAFQIQINKYRSNTPPAAFFGDLGYSMALSATEHNYNFICHKLNFAPSDWRLEMLAENYASEYVIKKSTSPETLKQTLQECLADSNFNKKHVAFSQMSLKNKLGRSIVSYSRGIGIATGNGIHGFSGKFPYNSQFSLSISMTEKDKITVFVGYKISRSLKRICREIIGKYFSLETEDISFADINNPEIKDAGPAVLFRTTSIIPSLVKAACKNLKKKITPATTFPITEEINSASYFKHIYFTSDCCGTIAVAMHLDSVKIIPIIDHITARLKTGKVFNPTNLSVLIRQAISDTVSTICPSADNMSDIDLKIRSNPNNPPGFSLSMIRGLTAAALTTAISQALTYNTTRIPITEDYLTESLIKQGVNHEAELHN